MEMIWPVENGSCPGDGMSEPSAVGCCLKSPLEALRTAPSMIVVDNSIDGIEKAHMWGRIK